MENGADDGRRSATTAAPVVTFSERLSVPWWWYPVALACAAVLAGEFRLSGYPLTSWVPFVVLLPISLVVAWSFGRARVSVVDGALRVRDAALPLSAIERVVLLDAATLPRAVGRHGDPSAFVFVRAWTHGGVQIILNDARDPRDPPNPTPYWIVSSRRPAQLAAALQPTA